MVDESDEARRPEKILTTILPSKKDIDEHDTLRHCQDRSWYPHRVTGRGVGQRPTSVAEKRKKHTGCHVRLSVHDKSTNTIGATAVEAEGLAPFAVTYVAGSLQCIGHSDGINKMEHTASVQKKRRLQDKLKLDLLPKRVHPRNPRAMDTLSLHSRHDPKCQGES